MAIAKKKKKSVKKTFKKVVQKKTKAKPKIVAKAKAIIQAAVKTVAGKKATIPLSPVREHILVQQEEAPEKTPGGLFIPSTVQAGKPQRGVVVRVGRGNVTKKGQWRPFDVEIGNQVLFTQYAGTEVNVEGQKFLLLKESDILGVVEE